MKSYHQLEKSLLKTRTIFILICALLISQAYTIPIIPIGVSWSIWPTLSDIIVALIFISAIPLLRGGHLDNSHRAVFKLLIVTFFVCSISYLAFTLFGFNNLETRKGVTFGLYGLYRLIQVITVFGVISLLPLNDYRLRCLGKIAAAVSFFVIISVIATFFGILQSGQFAPYLPSELSVAGPWYFYIFSINKGLGTIGYNHAYVAAQILLLLMLRLHLCPKSKNLTNNILFVSGILACLLTGSRAGLFAILSYSLIIILKKPLFAVIVVLSPALLLILFSNQLLSSEASTSLIDRQSVIFSSDVENNLSGRDTIWQEGLSFMNEDPTRWISGVGFGSINDGPGNLHMMYFQILAELGVFALIAFLVFMLSILKRLYKTERQPKPVFWGTIVLLVSSLTQETFYPVPAMGVFLIFYIMVLSIALKNKLPRNIAITDMQE